MKWSPMRSNARAVLVRALAGIVTAAALASSVQASPPTNCPGREEVLGVYNVCYNATAGDGTLASPWTGWESTLNGRNANTESYFPAGYYRQSATINTKRGWTVRGAGRAASVIIAASGFNGAMFGVYETVNTSNPTYLNLEDFQLISNNLSSASSGIDVVAATYVTIKRVLTYGFAVGVWLDQAELVDIEESSFLGTSQSVAGIYLVSGAYHTPDADPMYTNRIGIRKNQFNGGGHPNFIGVYDEGGVAHMIRDNNFEGGKHGVWYAGGKDLLIEGNEIENTLAEPISINVTIPNESRVEQSFNIAIRHNTMSPPAGYSSIVFPAPVSSQAVNGAEVANNLMATRNGDPVSIAGVNYVRNLLAYSNTNYSNTPAVPYTDLGRAQLQVLGSMSVSTTGALAVVPPTPPANTFYIYIDPANGELRAKGSSGTVTTLAVP